MIKERIKSADVFFSKEDWLSFCDKIAARYDIGFFRDNMLLEANDVAPEIRLSSEIDEFYQENALMVLDSAGWVPKIEKSYNIVYQRYIWRINNMPRPLFLLRFGGFIYNKSSKDYDVEYMTYGTIQANYLDISDQRAAVDYIFRLLRKISINKLAWNVMPEGRRPPVVFERCPYRVGEHALVWWQNDRSRMFGSFRSGEEAWGLRPNC